MFTQACVDTYICYESNAFSHATGECSYLEGDARPVVLLVAVLDLGLSLPLHKPMANQKVNQHDDSPRRHGCMHVVLCS